MHKLSHVWTLVIVILGASQWGGSKGAVLSLLRMIVVLTIIPPLTRLYYGRGVVVSVTGVVSVGVASFVCVRYPFLPSVYSLIVPHCHVVNICRPSLKDS